MWRVRPEKVCPRPRREYQRGAPSAFWRGRAIRCVSATTEVPMRSRTQETRRSIRRIAITRERQDSQPSDATLTAIDLFAGCGGATLGFKKEGLKVVAAVEVDRVSAETYRMNHPEVLLLERDIRKISPRALLKMAKLRRGEVTVVLGCPPCQGFSRVRRGAPDRRNALVRVFAEFVVAIRPQFFVLENVPGLAQGGGRRVFKKALSLLKDSGYSIVFRVLNAADYGVPQRRKRVVVIGRLRRSVALPIPTHCSPTRPAIEESGRIRLKPWVTVRQAIGRLKRLAAGKGDPDDPLHAAPAHSKIVLRRIRRIPRNGGSRSSLPKTLVLECHYDHDGHRDVYGRMKWSDIGPTITGGCDRVSKGRFIHPEQKRGITMREAALLQTFPKSYLFAGGRSAVALQIGNAVPVRFARAMARAVKEAALRSPPRPETAVEGTLMRLRETFGNLMSDRAVRRQSERRTAHSGTVAATGARRVAAGRYTGRTDRLVRAKAA
ncbi:MAG: DNA cytosine methyltransferase [bacterium]